MATTQVVKKTLYGFGSAGHGDLQQQFATLLVDYAPDVALELQQTILDGIQAQNVEFGAVDMDYTAAPTVEKFYPDRGWPAGGTTNAADIALGPEAKSSGAGSTASPAEFATKISKHKIGDYIFGRSSS